MLYLRAWRKYRGYSQIQLGKMARVRQATISQIEKELAIPHHATLFVLAYALGVMPQELYGPPPGYDEP